MELSILIAQLILEDRTDVEYLLDMVRLKELEDIIKEGGYMAEVEWNLINEHLAKRHKHVGLN